MGFTLIGLAMVADVLLTHGKARGALTAISFVAVTVWANR
jgi:hypothetical protein